jgi:CopA family copper-resistance protein
MSRRQFVQGLAAGGVVASGALWPRPLWALKSASEPQVLGGTDFDLVVGESPVNYTGRTRPAITVNGSLPAPVLRWREGTTVELRVRNAIPRSSTHDHGHQTSIHWHGILLPANMDGVPGVSFNGIGPGETYVYRFDVRQSGTYWYHGHSLFQEQAGLYGALIIDPAGPELVRCDRDYVVLLSDWTDLDPHSLFARLKKMPGHDNYYQRTVGDFVRDVERYGWSAATADRRMWGEMRMTPTDLSDVNANTYTYLMNGVTATGNWTGLFARGEKVRLRFINGSAMTYFDVRIPGLKMTVIAADGQPVHPVSVDEFRIAVAETYDVLVEPAGQDAYAIFAQDMGRTGYVSGTLATRAGLRAPVPSLDPRPLLTMADMGHAGGAHVHAAAGAGSADAAHAAHAGHDLGTMPDMDHQGGTATSHAARATHGVQSHPASESGNPLVDMQTSAPVSRLDDPGIGLRDNGRRVLRYADLHSAFEDPDGRDPAREIELHLTGHMDRFAWSFDGIRFADAEPLKLNYGERLRIVLVNDTMMTHPIHLHGMWSDMEADDGSFQLRKHTVDMPPGSRRSYRVRADALGRWAYHCHLLYHMEAGMMRVVRVEE